MYVDNLINYYRQAQTKLSTKLAIVKTDQAKLACFTSLRDFKMSVIHIGPNSYLKKKYGKNTK